MSPRPDGYDYSKPDPEESRCKHCNPNGMNRTGLYPISYDGALATVMISIPCPAGCNHGLIEPVYGKV